MANRQDHREGGLRGLKVRGPYRLCAIKSHDCNISLRRIFMKFISLKRVFARTVDFDDSVYMIQTIVVIFLFNRHSFYPSESVIVGEGWLIYRSDSIFLAFSVICSQRNE